MNLELRNKIFKIKNKETKLNTTEEPHLVQLLQQTFKENKINENLFIYKFIETQLSCLLLDDARAFRWDSTLVHWATTIQYHGGQKLLNIIRGEALQFQGKNGSLKVVKEKWGLFLPSVSTLKHYKHYVRPYLNNLEEQCKNISRILLNSSDKTGGLVFDEMEIRHGLTYLKSTGRILGLVLGELFEENIHEFLLQNEDILSLIGKTVMQVFFISTNGLVSIPIWYFLSNKTTGESVFNQIKEIVNELKKQEINITWGSSDGFTSSRQYILKMKENFNSYHHVYNYVHILKLLRNVLLNKLLHYKVSSFGFCIRDLIDLYEDNVQTG